MSETKMKTTANVGVGKNSRKVFFENKPTWYPSVNICRHGKGGKIIRGCRISIVLKAEIDEAEVYDAIFPILKEKFAKDGLKVRC